MDTVLDADVSCMKLKSNVFLKEKSQVRYSVAEVGLGSHHSLSAVTWSHKTHDI